MKQKNNHRYYNNLSAFFSENRSVLLLYLLVLTASSVVLLFYSKVEIHLFINSYYTPLADKFFKYITYLGDGIFIIIVSLLLLLHTFRSFLIQLSAYLASGILAQLGKRVFFKGMPRPAAVIPDSLDLHFVDGVKIALANTFPSGHTTSAFAFFFCLIGIISNRWLKIIFLVLACLVGYSRMYLSLHFLPDVLAGSIIGTVCAILISSAWNSAHKQWLDKSIIKIFSK